MWSRLLFTSAASCRNCAYSVSCHSDRIMLPASFSAASSWTASARRMAPRDTSRAHSTRVQANSLNPHAFESSPLHSYMVEALRAVRVASQACMSVQRSLQQESINTKIDDSPVTIADYAAQAIIAWILQKSCNGRLSLVAEETSKDMLGEENAATLVPEVTGVVNRTLAEAFDGFKQLSDDDVIKLIDLGDSEGGYEGKHWVLDPIDGTRGFENKRQYSVCLGLLQDGEPVLGVLGCPNMPAARFSSEYSGPRDDAGHQRDGVGLLFAAIQGCGTYETDLLTTGMPELKCSTSDVPAVSEALFMESYDSRHSNHSTTSQIAAALSIQKPPMQLDSQCKYGLLARGDADLFMRFPHSSYREKIWDHAAGLVILQEAGGLITDGMGRKLDFGLGRYLDGMQNGIVAAAPSLHAAVMTAVKENVSKL